ncbi:hypothetical protein [Rhodococcus aetherivorans]|uniref:hypothetical protein n=1 Tax=Rhodococcus aetherivorans TaxID=191292 RepID=UPI00045D4AA4|nr:hypothetical protein [Rhodococcus aetherivorans]KDE12425.1 hypothetical protein N505_0115365 [Rhodococcus aetherivorans]
MTTYPGRMPKQRDALLAAAILRATPDLRGAACAGPQAYLWDAGLDGAGETRESALDRWQAAEARCLTCPVLASCRDVAATGGLAGVVAGRLHNVPGVQDGAVPSQLVPARGSTSRYATRPDVLRERKRERERLTHDHEEVA